MNTLRWMVGIIVLMALTTASVVVPASPASASPEYGACYGRDSFYFQHEWDRETSTHTIHVYTNDSCADGIFDPILWAEAWYDASQDVVYLSVKDEECDSTGLTLYTHGPSLSTHGCHEPVDTKLVQWTDLSGPPHFWVRVKNRTNSEPETMPPHPPLGPR
jgi:hypothetical protein